MSTINIDLAADTILNVMIGQQDENEVREVVFDFSGWYTTYGSGTISLAIQRPKDEWPYEGTLTVDSTNHKATWEISDTDTAYAGTGQIQLSYKVGDAKKKSVVYRFTCHKSLGALGSVVTPVQIQTFIDEVEEALQTMDGKLDDMEDEITDVKSDLSNIIDNEIAEGYYRVKYATVNHYYIARSTPNEWSSRSTRNGYIFPVNSEALQVTIVANDTNVTAYALLKDNLQSAGGSVNYCDGTTRNEVQPSESVTLSIPSDCNYMWVLKDFDGANYEPNELNFHLYQDPKTYCVVYSQSQQLTDTEKTTARDNIGAADAQATSEEFATIEDILYESKDLDFSEYGTVNVLISSSEGKWSTGTNRNSYFIPVNSSDKKVKITANQTNYVVFAMLKTSAHVQSTYPDYATGSERTIINAGETQLFNIPSDCNFLYFLKDYNSADHLPTLVEITSIKEFEPKYISYPLGLHEIPENDGVLNIIKRCRQLTDVKWTPATDLPRYMYVQRSEPAPDSAEIQSYLGTFKGGVEYTGIPYGRVLNTLDNYGYDYGTVGNYIGLGTFVSSVSNSESRLCKDNVSSVSGHRSVIYATVCSGLTCYAINVPEVATASIGSISGMSQIGKLNDNGVLLDDSLIKLGDILNNPGEHTAVVTDIVRDNDGIIQFIELSEATTKGLADRNYSDGQVGGVCRRKGWTREQLFAVGMWGDYYVLRYSGASQVPYTPSPYVNVGDEFDMCRIEHYPCMPYEGEGFAFKTGYIPNNAVTILISLTGYDYLRVFKDGTEITGSPFSTTGVASINIPEISAGEYKAYMCNMSNGNVTNLTVECHWSIA